MAGDGTNDVGTLKQTHIGTPEDMEKIAERLKQDCMRAS